MQSEERPRALRVLWALALTLIVASLAMVWFYAPMERVMGLVQKVFYFHVAANWLGMLSFIIAAGMAVLYLITRDPRWDRLEVAAVEIGWAFSIMGVVSGSVWARPIWNTWWTQDPRLVTVTVMVLLYSGYFLFRRAIIDPERRARHSSVYALVAVVTVPLTFLSARIYRTIHPVVVGKSSADAMGGFDMAPEMRLTMFFTLFAFTVLYAAMLWERYRLETAQRALEEEKARLLEV